MLIYLTTVVPAIWLLEIQEFDRRERHYARAAKISSFNNQTISDEPDEVPVDLKAYIGKVLGVITFIHVMVQIYSQ